MIFKLTSKTKCTIQQIQFISHVHKLIFVLSIYKIINRSLNLCIDCLKTIWPTMPCQKFIKNKNKHIIHKQIQCLKCYICTNLNQTFLEQINLAINRCSYSYLEQREFNAERPPLNGPIQPVKFLRRFRCGRQSLTSR